MSRSYMITAEELKELFSYDPETGVFTRLKSRRTDKIGQHAGAIGRNGYVYINVRGRLHLAHRLAWIYVYGAAPEGHIDHINRNREDNRLVNLRVCPTKQRGNGQNCSLRKDSSSGFTGVHWFKRTKKWQVYITLDGKRRNLGYFTDLDAAKKAYAEAKSKLHSFHTEVVYGE